MSTKRRLLMAYHGVMVILLGLLAGFPYAFVVTGQMAGEERAWRMAHSEGIQNGMMVLAIAGVAGLLQLDERKSHLCAWSFILAAYGNVIASVIGASTGTRGLEFAMPVANIVVYFLFVVAVLGVVTGLVVAAQGARAALREQ